MHVLVAFVALGLLVVVLYPLVSRRLRAARRERAVHLGGSCHWYANYDDELRYEPKRRSDIVRLSRSDVLSRGYLPTEDVQLVPRTFRHRVPGDVRIRLWKCNRAGVPALWLCEWATDPVRVSIGTGERERVPGVESAPIPIGAWADGADEPRPVAAGALGAWDISAREGERLEPAGENDVASDWAELARVREPDATAPAASELTFESVAETVQPDDPAGSALEGADEEEVVLAEEATVDGSNGDAAPGGSRRRRRRRRSRS